MIKENEILYVIENFINVDFFYDIKNNEKQMNLISYAALYANLLENNLNINLNPQLLILLKEKVSEMILESYYDKDSISINYGVTSVLYALNIIFKGKEINTSLFNSLIKILNDNLSYILCNEKFTEYNFDTISGVCGVLSYLINIENDSAIFLEMECIDYLIKICGKSNFEEMYVKKFENESGVFLDSGVAHGIGGIYNCLISWRKKRRKSILKVNELINKIEFFLFKIDETDKLLMIDEFVLLDQNPIYHNITNYSWCYGISGYINSILENSIFEGSIFFNRRKEIKYILKNNISHLYSTESHIFETNTFCHGLPGFLYSILISDEKYYSELINITVEKIIQKYKKDNKKFLGDNCSVTNLLVDGSIGSILVLISYMKKTRFLGDAVFNL